MSDNVLELVSLLSSDDKFKQRLAELNKGVEDAKIAEDKAAKARSEAEEFIKAADQVRQAHAGELAGHQRRHDEAAAEAALRIQVGREQAAELMRIREEQDVRRKELNTWEDRLRKSEKQLLESAADLTRRRQEYDENMIMLQERLRLAREFMKAMS